MSKLWFKAKNYGWGWYPASWEGWVTILAFVVLMILSAFFLAPETTLGLVAHFLMLISTTSLLLAICLKKGEKPEWRWGDKK